MKINLILLPIAIVALAVVTDSQGMFRRVPKVATPSSSRVLTPRFKTQGKPHITKNMQIHADAIRQPSETEKININIDKMIDSFEEGRRVSLIKYIEGLKNSHQRMKKFVKSEFKHDVKQCSLFIAGMSGITALSLAASGDFNYILPSTAFITGLSSAAAISIMSFKYGIMGAAAALGQKDRRNAEERLEELVREQKRAGKFKLPDDIQ